MSNDLTVIIPAYNEQGTIVQVVETVLQTPRVGQVIVSDDGSTDETLNKLEKFRTNPRVTILANEHVGKGHAVRSAFAHADKKYLIVQDSDLELSPSSYQDLFVAIEEQGADVANGVRNLEQDNVAFISKIAGMMIPAMVLFLFGRRIKDVACGYKLMETEKYRQLNITSDHFELETEIICKSIRQGYKIVEVPVSFKPRSRAQGKHIDWKDGLRVISWLLRYRFGLS